MIFHSADFVMELPLNAFDVAVEVAAGIADVVDTDRAADTVGGMLLGHELQQLRDGDAVQKEVD